MTLETYTFENNLTINWERGLDGGGADQYKDFIDYLKKTNKKYKHCLEWCAGLGAIGYSILDAGICETITFMDKYEPAERFALENAELNNISDKVFAFTVDNINDLPTDLKFDLVVANPPHTPDEMSPEQSFSREEHVMNSRLIVDLNWNTHREFFANIKKHLAPNADIILSEIGIREEHIAMAEENELSYVGSVPAPILAKYSSEGASLMIYKNETKVY